jgi:hypothetical protein
MQQENFKLLHPLSEAIRHFYEPKNVSALAKTKYRLKPTKEQKETLNLHIGRKGGW